MLSKTLLKMSKMLFAAKWSAFLNLQIYKQILKNQLVMFDESNNAIVIPDVLGDSTLQGEKAGQQLMNALQQLDNYQGVREKVQNFRKKTTEEFEEFIKNIAQTLSQCTKKNININKQFAMKIYDMAKKSGNDILQQFERDNILSIVRSYKQYYEFLDKQYKDFNQFEDFEKINYIVSQYKHQQQESNKKLSKAIKIWKSGNYKICKYDNYKDLHDLTAGSGWCVSGSEYYFNNYGGPYYVVLKNNVVHHLINFNSYQNKALGNQTIKDMDKQLAELEMKLMEEEYHGKTKYAYRGDFRCLHQFYPVQQLIDAVNKKQIDKSIVQKVLIATLQGNDDKKFDKLTSSLSDDNAIFNLKSLIKFISTDNQYKKIMLKVFPNTDKKVSDQVHLKNSVKIDKSDVISIMFNSFKRGKSGLGLFGRIIKFAQNPQGGYSQYDNINKQLVSQKDEKGTKLVNYITKLNQVKMLGALGIQLQKSDVNTLLHNLTNVDSVNPQLLDYLKNNNLLQLDANLLTTVTLTRKPGVISYFLQKTDMDFNQRMTTGQLPILYVLKNNAETIFKIFKESDKIKIDPKGQDSSELLYCVMRGKNKDIIAYFLNDTELDFNQVMYQNMTPLFYVVKQRMNDVFDLFVNSNKIDLQKTVNGRNLLYWSVETKNKELTEKLCAKAKNVNQIYISGTLADKTILMYALQNKDTSLIKVLLSNDNINVNVLSPLQWCMMHNDKGGFETLLNHKSFSGDFKDNNGDTLLTFAIKNDKAPYDYFKKVLAKTKITEKLNVNVNGIIMTPLMLAIDYQMPLDLIKSSFKESSFRNNKGSLNSIIDIINNKLTSKPRDPNMLAIKQWVTNENANKKVNKQVNKEQQLLKFAIGNKFKQFSQYLHDNRNTFDFTKQVSNNGTIFDNLIKFDYFKPYLEAIVQYLQMKNPNVLNDILQEKKNGKTLLQRTMARKIKSYLTTIYQMQNIKTAKKRDRIFNFVANYIR